MAVETPKKRRGLRLLVVMVIGAIVLFCSIIAKMPDAGRQGTVTPPQTAVVAHVEPTTVPTATRTRTPYPTSTAMPTYTPWPTYTLLPTLTPVPTQVPPTASPEPSPIPPSPTPHPTNTAVPQATAVPEARLLPLPTSVLPVPSGYKLPVLTRPGEGHDIYEERGNTTFEWTWGGQLKDDEYFQVQIISRDASNLGEHRGIHAPTKGFGASTNRDLWGHFRDWEGVYDRPRFGADARIYADWTVTIVKWDGIDPSKIGPPVIEAAPRYIKF